MNKFSSDDPQSNKGAKQEEQSTSKFSLSNTVCLDKNGNWLNWPPSNPDDVEVLTNLYPIASLSKTFERFFAEPLVNPSLFWTQLVKDRYYKEELAVKIEAAAAVEEKKWWDFLSCHEHFPEITDYREEHPKKAEAEAYAQKTYEEAQEASKSSFLALIEWFDWRFPPVEHPKVLSGSDTGEEAEEQSNSFPSIQREKAKKVRELLPALLPQMTFIEARQHAQAISDARSRQYWGLIQGAVAVLHSPPKSKLSTRFEPSQILLNWWGAPIAHAETLYSVLEQLTFEDVILFHVVLSAILHDEKARFTISIDGLIKLIGRDTDARRSASAREEIRRKIWRSLVIFDSMAVYGTRPGRWREPAATGEKRNRMDEQKLYSCDPLLRIVGTRATEQGTFDSSGPPKEVSIVPGEWLMPFHGNKEVLSEIGSIHQIAQIARGKVSGAWAACAALMLNQLWREEATRAHLGRNGRTTREGETKIEVLKFRPFTRRELLAGSLRSDHDVNKILSDPKGRRDRVDTYWKEAVKELKKSGGVAYYSEGNVTRGDSWQEEWLDQPLNIRPAGEALENVLTINKSCEAKKRRGRPKKEA